MDQLQKHNERALLYVIDEYGGLLKAVISKSLFRMHGYQEECMNDVLLAIWDHIDSFQPEKNSFKNWIAAIAKYKAIDYLRKYQKEQMEVSLETAECDRIMESKPPAVADADEISEEMEELLSCLSKRDRDLFLRLYVEEESVEEISQSAKLSNRYHIRYYTIFNYDKQIGKHLQITISDLKLWFGDDMSQVDIKGKWTFDVMADCKDSSVDFAQEQELQFGKEKATLKECRILSGSHFRGEI